MIENVFIDVDLCIFDTERMIVELYNSIYNTNLDYTKIEKYDFKPIINDEELPKMLKLFNSPLLYTKDGLYEDVLDSVNRLQEKYKVYFVTIGTPENLYYKNLLMNKVFPKAEFIGINKQGSKMNKDIIYLPNSVLLDDHSLNLKTSRNDHKILMQRGNRLREWNEVYFNEATYVTNMQEFENKLNWRK